MSLTKTTELKLTKIVVKWELDEDCDMMDRDPDCLILRTPCSYDRNLRHEVDPGATVDALVNVAGCPKDEALAQAARMIDTFQDWQEGRYYYLGCIVKAIAEMDGEEVEVGTDSLWGIEMDCGAYAEEVRSEMMGQLFDTVVKAGYEVTQEEFDALPVEDAENTYTPGPEHTSYARPLDPLPTLPGGYTAKYVYDWKTVEVEITCDECGAEVTVEDIKKGNVNLHESYCPLREDED